MANTRARLRAVKKIPQCDARLKINSIFAGSKINRHNDHVPLPIHYAYSCAPAQAIPRSDCLRRSVFLGICVCHSLFNGIIRLAGGVSLHRLRCLKEKMHMKYYIKWFVGLVLMLASISMLSTGLFITALCYALGSIVCLPPLSFLTNEWSSGSKYLAFIVFMVSGLFSTPRGTIVDPVRTIGTQAQSNILKKKFSSHEVDSILASDSIALKDSVIPVTYTSKTTPSETRILRKQSDDRIYYRGPRGGCYYINGNGKKTYVDRSICD
jgi:hypothetical protein